MDGIISLLITFLVVITAIATMLAKVLELKSATIKYQRDKAMNGRASNTSTKSQFLSFRNFVSVMSLLIAFVNFTYVMFGPPRDEPLTGETGALLAYGLAFLYMSFSLVTDRR